MIQVQDCHIIPLESCIYDVYILDLCCLFKSEYSSKLHSAWNIFRPKYDTVILHYEYDWHPERQLSCED